MTRKSPAASVILALCLSSIAGSGAPAQTADGEPGIDRSALSAYAQAGPRPRINVRPRCFYRRETVDFPLPYDCEYPGSGYVRKCTSWLAREARPSGTVVVPQMRCWWAPG